METWNNILKEHMVSNEKVMNIKVVELIDLYNFCCWSYFHVTKFEQFKISISINDTFKQNFEIPNLNSKSYEQKSCRTHQDLQLLFWSFLHPTK